MTMVKRFEYRGIDCAIRRVFALCGYVQVPKGHPWAGKHYDEPDVDIHGGLTFGDGGEGGDLGPGWWIGFDCGHAGDAFTVEGYEMPGEARSVEYVEKELRGLVDQLLAVTEAAA